MNEKGRVTQRFQGEMSAVGRRTWTSGLAVLLVALISGVAFSQPQRSSPFGFIFLPFQNNSDFKGRWELRADVSRYLVGYTKARYGVPAVSPVVVLNYLHHENLPDEALGDMKFWKDLYKQFGYRFLVAGSINDFDVSRFTTATPEVGGYEAFKGEASISYDIYDMEQSASSATAIEVTKGEARGEFSDRSLALTLLGKPTQRTVEYHDLDQIGFGSEDFNRTVIGQACLRMAEQFSSNLEMQFPLLRSKEFLSGDLPALPLEISDSTDIVFKGRIVTGSIVFIENGDAFVNIGSEDGIRTGQLVSVYPQAPKGKDTTNVRESPKVFDRKIGELEVKEIRGPHLTLARIKSGKKEIKLKDRVRVRVLE